MEKESPFIKGIKDIKGIPYKELKPLLLKLLGRFENQKEAEVVSAGIAYMDHLEKFLTENDDNFPAAILFAGMTIGIIGCTVKVPRLRTPTMETLTDTIERLAMIVKVEQMLESIIEDRKEEQK